MSEDKYKVDCRAKKCAVYEGGNASLDIKEGECEVRRDVVIKNMECVRIWGQVKDCRGCPVEGALLKLVKQVYKGHKYWYIGIAHTLTDCQGFYQFDLCRREDHCTYRVIAGKAAMERYYDRPSSEEHEKRPGHASISDEEVPGEADQAADEDFLEDDSSGSEEAVDAEDEDTDARAEEQDASEVDEALAAPEEDELEPAAGEAADEDEYPHKSVQKKVDKFDPDRDLPDDAEEYDYDRYGCDPCRYFMKD